MVQHLGENSLTRECYPVALGYYPKAFGHKMERRVHQDHLLIYCTGGEGTVHIDACKQVIQAGDIIILPRGVAHQYQTTRKNPWSIYWIHFTGLLANDFLHPLLADNQTSAVIPLGLQAKIINDFETMLGVRQTGYNRRNFIHASNILRQLLSYLSIALLRTTNRESAFFDIDAVHALMQEKLHGQLGLEELARRVNLSKYHFSSRYKTLTGQSPIQHFLHLKMEHACYLLDTSGSSIKDISRNLGYEDSYYFSRLFKKIIGVSPRQYRQLKRG